MYRLTSTTYRVAFCLAITAFALGMATGIEFVFYPEEYATTAPGKKAIVVFAIALPTSWAISGMMRNNYLLTEQLSALVNRDRLTDVATRDYFFSKMEDNPDAYGVSLMVDIDHFKQVNDVHGHLAGDQVIAHVAQTLRSCVRSNDIVARFGGEEFVIFLIDHDSDVGYAVAERMRSSIEQQVCQIDGTSLPVTVSIGGSLKEAVDHIERSIKDADDALYRAKALGRNCTVFGAKKQLVAKSA